MTLATSTVGATGWEAARCGGATPRYRGTDFSPCMSPKYGLVWGVNWGDKTSTVTGDITFSSAISCLSFVIHDINRNATDAICSNVWTDVVEVTGFNGATPVTPNFSQADASQQTITLSGNTRIATANEASLGDGVTFSFSSPITRVLIVYKSGANVSSTTGCPGGPGATGPSNQFIVIGTITGSAANYGTITSANQAGCPPLTTNAINFSTSPSGATGYQWYSIAGINTCPSGSSTTGWTLISGATGASNTPPSPAYADITYACYVTAACGSQWASGCRQIDVNTSNATSSPALSANDYLWVSSASPTITIDSDDSDSRFTRLNFGVGAGANASYVNSNARVSTKSINTTTATATFAPNITNPGVYSVYASVLKGTNRVNDVLYTINHQGGQTDVRRSQYSNPTAHEWIYLGDYNFNLGTTGNVIVTNNSLDNDAGRTIVILDAIRFVKVGGSIDYELASNWLQWTGSGYQTVASPPSTTNNVFIKPIVDCVYESPTVDNVITTAGAVGSANSNNITIASGAILNFSTNNSHLHINGDYLNQGTVNPGTGRVKFIKSGTQTLTDASGTATFYEMNVALTSTAVLSSSVTVTNAIRLSGVITTGSNRVYLNTTAVDGLTTGFVTYTGHVFGNLRRRVVTNTNSYFFPVGVSNVLNTGRRLLVWMNNNTTGITDLDCSVSNAFKGSGNNIDARLDIANKAKSYAQVLNFVRSEAEWTLTPISSMTGGSYGLQLYLQNFAALADNKFTIMKRDNSSTDFFDFNTFYLTTSIPAVNAAGRIYNSGNGYAEKTGFTAFSKFVVATSPDILPIELINYNIECAKNKAVLSWQTASETNNHYFTIWRSEDGVNFDSLAFVYGAGNSSQLINYTWTDHFANDLTPSNYYYYKISQTDFSGEKTVFETKFFDKSCDVGTYVFPNPIYDKGTLAFYVNGNSKVSAILYNHIGQLVRTFMNHTSFDNGSHLTELNFDGISSGIYYLNVTINDEPSTLKISVQKE